MFSIPLAAVATAGALAMAASPALAVSDSTVVPDVSAPYVAYLGNCTGTLVAPDRVLTAAHCADVVSPDGGTVVIGTDDVGGNAGFVGGVLTPVVPPQSAVYHATGFAAYPGFRLRFPFAHKRLANATADDDVAIVSLDRPVTGIPPVRLAGPGDAAAVEQPGSPVTLLGYGQTTPEVPSVTARTLLRSGALTLLPASRCAATYPRAVDPASEICAQDVAPGPFTEPCAGDSGGPLIAQTAGGPVQIGVTSWGAEVTDARCGTRRLPSVSMRVSRFMAFITDPAPVFEPHTQARPVVRRGRRTLICTAPVFAGSPARLTYAWGRPRYPFPLRQDLPHPMSPLPGARTRELPRTRAARGRQVVCAVTARNAGGRWTTYSRAVRVT